MVILDKFKNFINKSGKILALIIAICICILLLIKIFVNDPQYYKDSKKLIKESQSKVDSIYNKQDSLNSRLENLEKGQIMFYDVINTNNQLMVENNKKLDKLRKLYNEKIINVDRYSISDLDSFFRARYSRFYQEEN